MEQTKILIIDDHSITLDVVHDILYDEECYTIYTSTSIPHLNFIRKLNPDIILLDIIVRNRDGRNFCKMVRRNRFLKNMKIILFSAYIDEKSSAIESGADDFFKKPFEIDDLIRIVAKYSKKNYTCIKQV